MSGVTGPGQIECRSIVPIGTDLLLYRVVWRGKGLLGDDVNDAAGLERAVENCGRALQYLYLVDVDELG